MKRLIPLVLAGLILDAAPLAKGQECGADKLGWQLGIHAYTFKNFPFPEAVDKTKALGIQYMGVSGSINLGGKLKRTHLMTDEELASVRKKLNEAGIKLVNWGVVHRLQVPAVHQVVTDHDPLHHGARREDGLHHVDVRPRGSSHLHREAGGEVS